MESALTNSSIALNVHSKPASKSRHNAVVVHSDENESSDASETFQETNVSNSGSSSRPRRHTLPSFKRKEIDLANSEGEELPKKRRRTKVAVVIRMLELYNYLGTKLVSRILLIVLFV